MHEFVLIRFWILLDSNPCLQYLPLADPRPDCEDVTRRILRWVSPVDELIPGVGGDPAPPPPAQLHSTITDRKYCICERLNCKTFLIKQFSLILLTTNYTDVLYREVVRDFPIHCIQEGFTVYRREGKGRHCFFQLWWSLFFYLEFMKHILKWTMFLCVHFRKHFSFRFCYSLHTWL